MTRVEVSFKFVKCDAGLKKVTVNKPVKKSMLVKNCLDYQKLVTTNISNTVMGILIEAGAVRIA